MYERVASFLIGILIVFGTAATAQETTGSLQGQVVDPQKLAVPGATVTVTGPQGARTFVTDGEGRWVAPFLTPGPYTVRVELQGFKAAEQLNVQVSLGQRREVNIQLETGGLTETPGTTYSTSESERPTGSRASCSESSTPPTVVLRTSSTGAPPVT